MERKIHQDIHLATFGHVFHMFEELFEIGGLREKYEDLEPPLREDLYFIYSELETNVWKFTFDNTSK